MSDEFMRPLTDIEAKVFARDDSKLQHSFWLEKLGFVNDPPLPADATDEQRNARMGQIGKAVESLFSPRGEAAPKMQRKFYIGKPTMLSVDFLRHYTALVCWAERINLMVCIEADGRIYLTSSYWNYRDPNTLQHTWMGMTFDGLAMSMEQFNERTAR